MFQEGKHWVTKFTEYQEERPNESLPQELNGISDRVFASADAAFADNAQAVHNAEVVMGNGN